MYKSKVQFSQIFAFLAFAKVHNSLPTSNCLVVTMLRHVSQTTKYWLLCIKNMIYPKGLVINIIDIKIGGCNFSCKEHEICGSVLNNNMVMHLWILLFFPFLLLVCYICILQSLPALSLKSILFSSCSISFFWYCIIHTTLCRNKIWCAGEEETALTVYWVTDGFDWCQVWFFHVHLIKLVDKHNGALALFTYIYITVHDSKYGRQKVYENHGFVRVVLISECDATK